MLAFDQILANITDRYVLHNTIETHICLSLKVKHTGCNQASDTLAHKILALALNFT